MLASTRTSLAITICTLACCVSVAAYHSSPSATQAVSTHPASQSSPAAPGQASPAGPLAVAAQNALVQRYCVVCHDDAQKTGGLTLQHFDAAHPDRDVFGNMVDMLKSGAMPPAGMPRPDRATIFAFTNALSAEAVGESAASASAASAPLPTTAGAPKIIAFAHTGDVMAVAEQNRLVHTICTQCHTDARKPGGLSFEHLNMATLSAEHPEIAEHMLAKLLAGMMPKAGAPVRPDQPSIHAFITSLETRIDRAAARHPEAGSRLSQRLNRVEYASSIKSMLGLDVDVSQWLPPDTISHNFDNIAAVQDVSPTLLQGYLEAASEISRLAVGDPEATPSSTSYTISEQTSQMAPVAGAPLGTRGGVSVVHIFPADGTYRFKLLFYGTLGGRLFGLTAAHQQIEVSINDRRVALLDVDPTMSEATPHGMTLETGPIEIKAGPQRVSAAFLEQAEGPIDDLVTPQAYTLADLDIGDSSGAGLTILPHLRTLTISGPFHVTGISDTVSRDRIFICRPTSHADESPCARRIISHLASQAYRRPATPAEVDALLTFYDRGRARANFEEGVRLALQALLSSTHFIFRLEPQPVVAHAGSPYRVDDVALASRLSFFLWASPPDATLLKLAQSGRLHERTVLDAQVARMLKDPRAYALSVRFAAQWLRLQDVDKVRPDALNYPMYDARIEHDMVEETEQFFNSIVAENRSVLDLLTADYTYANETLARFYGIPNVAGPGFRKVSLAGTHRQGLLGQGSIQVETSVADRSDPVLRGKWVLEVLLGQPPPPPPPNVNTNLDDTAQAVENGKTLSVRQRMEEHRANPFCASCHSVIDPIGLAMENFGPSGHWRIRDNEVPVDASTVLYDGTKMDGLAGLNQALLAHKDTFLQVFTENLMAYAIGRQVEYFDMPTIRAIDREAAAHGYHFASYVIGIVNSPAFRMSQPAAATAAVAGQ